MGRDVVCFWVLGGDDFNGVIVIGRDALREYLKSLSYSDRQGLQLTPFEHETLADVIKATDARILVLDPK